MKRKMLLATTAIVGLFVSLAVVQPTDAKLTSTNMAVTCPSPAPAEAVILTVGDSITLGASYGSTNTDSYRRELGRLLDLACVPHRFVVAASGGVPCEYWSSSIGSLVATNDPGPGIPYLLLLNCGTNNNPNDATKLAAFENTYRGLINSALNASSTLLVYPTWIQYSNYGPSWPNTPAQLKTAEPRVNDTIYRVVINPGHIEYGLNPGDRIPAVLDLQQIPHGYLDQLGVHSTLAGYDVTGKVIFNHIAVRLGLTPTAIPCGLDGRRYGGTIPSFAPCTNNVNLN